MECIYINLDSETSRRGAVEQTFRDNCPPSWRLQRLSAVTPTYIGEREIEGNLRDGEKACFLSHLKALDLAREFDGNVLIAEDDILLGNGSALAIEQALGTMAGNDWDLLFTDVCIAGIHAMIELFRLKRLLTTKKQ